MARIVVAGALANKPYNGGAAWTRLNWVLGFQKLVCEVLFIEQIDRNACVDVEGRRASFDDCVNRQWFRQVIGRFRLSGSACLVYENGDQAEGLTCEEAIEFARGADLLVNITGHLASQPVKNAVRCRAYIDLDPGYTQFWSADGNAGPRLDGHDFYFTVGENIGTPGCPIPTVGRTWRPIRQPVVLTEWPPTSTGDPARFTTIAAWRGAYGRANHNGHTYGLKADEFRRFASLPQRIAQRCEIALDIHPADRRDVECLQRHGWSIVDPRQAAATPDAFRDYIYSSGGELSVAQGIYVETNSGWFSDRTVRYLAAGKPALVQETGFSRNYPTGEGLIPFRTIEDAVAGAADIAANYDRHCRAARGLAERYFDSDRVLGRLLEQVDVSCSSNPIR